MDKIDWKEWFCHLMQVAYEIATDGKNLTIDEYEQLEKDGTESLSGKCFADNLTDGDIEGFRKWFGGIADRD